MKGGPKLSLREFLHRALQLFPEVEEDGSLTVYPISDQIYEALRVEFISL